MPSALFASLKPLWRWVKPFTPFMLGSLLAAIPLAFVRLGPAPLVKRILDSLLTEELSRPIWWYPLGFVLLFTVNFGVRYYHYYWMRVVVVGVSQGLKRSLYDHALSLSVQQMKGDHSGSLMSRLIHEPTKIEGGVASLHMLVREPLTLMCLLGYAFSLNWKLTGVVLIAAPFLAWVFQSSGRNLKRYAASAQQAQADAAGFMSESFQGLPTLKLYEMETYQKERFGEHLGLLRTWLLKSARLEELAHPTIELLSAIAIAPMMIWGAIDVRAGIMSPGDLFAFFTTFALMMHPIRVLNDVNIKLQHAAASMDRLMDWFRIKPSMHFKVGTPPVLKEGFQFKHVTFGYEPSRPIVKNLSLHIPKGQWIALVGESGSGKSTFSQLLTRLIDPCEGQILLNGCDMREYPLGSVHALFAMVSQDVFIFDDTVEANIRCGNEEVSFEAVKSAALQADALDFIQALPQGFKTRVGERGGKLSGGERQRLSMARAFLRQAQVLILDEATSNLDPESERSIQLSLKKLMKNKTCLMIAHRLKLIQEADCIYVMKDGEIIEAGSHKSLMDQNGQYARWV